MNDIEFQRKSCEFVADFSNSVNETKIKPEDVIIVWRRNSKICMLSTHINDGRYYEVTYNKEKDQLDLILITKSLIKLKKID